MEFYVGDFYTSGDKTAVRDYLSRKYGPASYGVCGYGSDEIVIWYEAAGENYTLRNYGLFDFDEAEALADEIRATVARVKLAKLREGE